jgi:hypothetical protein
VYSTDAPQPSNYVINAGKPWREQTPQELPQLNGSWWRPDVLTGPLEISRDSKRLYFSLRVRYANIWMLTLEQEQ